MITKTIKYIDYNGVEREEKFLFNLSKAELMELEMGTTGGLAETIQKIVETKEIFIVQQSILHGQLVVK